MVRLGSVALIVLSLPAAAWSGPPATAEDPRQSRNFSLPRPADHRLAPDGMIGRTEIAPNAHFGFGIFGLKIERPPLQAVTGRELIVPKQRRAAVGFTLKF